MISTSLTKQLYSPGCRLGHWMQVRKTSVTVHRVGEVAVVWLGLFLEREMLLLSKSCYRYWPLDLTSCLKLSVIEYICCLVVLRIVSTGAVGKRGSEKEYAEGFEEPMCKQRHQIQSPTIYLFKTLRHDY